MVEQKYNESYEWLIHDMLKEIWIYINFLVIKKESISDYSTEIKSWYYNDKEFIEFLEDGLKYFYYKNPLIKIYVFTILISNPLYDYINSVQENTFKLASKDLKYKMDKLYVAKEFESSKAKQLRKIRWIEEGIIRVNMCDKCKLCKDCKKLKSIQIKLILTVMNMILNLIILFYN